MNGEPTKIYDADNGAEAEVLREALEAEGIDAALDLTPGPLDGLTAMGQGVPIYVGANDLEKARAIIREATSHWGDSEDDSDTDDADVDDRDEDNA
jgi:hypothetical protein